MKNIFKNLDSDLRKNRRQIFFSHQNIDYKIFKESTTIVDKFYNENKLNDIDLLYKRLTDLKKNVDISQIVDIPIYISIFFSVYISFITNIFGSINKIFSNFKNTAPNYLEQAKKKLTEDNFKNYSNMYNQTMHDTYIKFFGIFFIMLILSIILALLLKKLIADLYKINFCKNEIIKYELNCLNGDSKILLHIENDNYTLEYKLNKVLKK